MLICDHCGAVLLDIIDSEKVKCDYCRYPIHKIPPETKGYTYPEHISKIPYIIASILSTMIASYLILTWQEPKVQGIQLFIAIVIDLIINGGIWLMWGLTEVDPLHGDDIG